LYAFNGTMNALATLPTDETFHLTRTFRFGATLAAAADKLLALKGERLPLRGARAKRTLLHTASAAPTEGEGPQLAVLVYKNATWFESGAEAAQAALSVYVEKPDDLAKHLAKLEKVAALDAAGREAKRRKAEEGGNNATLTALGLVKRFGAELPAMIAALRARWVQRRDNADSHFSTIHKAKGAEFGRVHLSADLWQHLVAQREKRERCHAYSALPLSGTGGESDALHMLYTALTRAVDSVAMPPGMAEALDAYARPTFLKQHCIGCLAPAPAAGRWMASLPVWSAGGEGSCKAVCAGCALFTPHARGVGVLLARLGGAPPPPDAL